MSVLNIEKKFIFIHVPKTAGTSMEEWNIMCPIIARHYSIADYEAQGLVDLDHYFKFAFVRNPYDRLSSWIFGHQFKQEKNPKELFNDFILDNRDKLSTMIVTKPQIEFLLTKDGKNVMDFIGSFEELGRCWDWVCRKISPGSTFYLPHINKNVHDNHRGHYTPETRSIVQEIYREDFNLFGYQM